MEFDSWFPPSGERSLRSPGVWQVENTVVDNDEIILWHKTAVVFVLFSRAWSM